MAGETTLQINSARPARFGALLALAAYLGLLLALPGDAAAARKKCAGKKATIVSNAKRIVGSKAHDVIVAGPRANVILGKGGNDTICGGGGGDTIHGGRGNDTLLGQGGDDKLHGERGSDRMDGGAGRDELFGEFGNDKMNGGPGDRDQVDAGPGDDTLSGGAGDFDVVFGGVGNDRIDGGPGAHDIASYKGVGGPITVDLANGTVNGAEQERLSGIEDVLGGPGSDHLIGSPASANRLDGGPGDDRLQAVGEGDEAYGGPGADACFGPFAAETACGGTGARHGTAVALISSITGASTLVVTGTEGPDDVTVGVSGDGYVLQGGGSVDVVLGETGAEACARSASSNTVHCRGSASSIQASLGAGNDTFAIDAGVPAGISAVIDGGAGSDTLRGGAGNDTIYGGDDRDSDTLEGGGGDDTLFGVNIFHPRRDSGAARMIGGPGDDLMVGGQPCGGDLFDGGPGANDSASFARIRNEGVNVQATIGGAVTDPDSGCPGGRIEASVEKIEGSPGPDVLIGDGGSNTLLGRGGNDVLDGRGGFDRCIEGGGSDRLSNCEVDSWRSPMRGRVR